MPRGTQLSLAERIQRLMAERQKHADALARIDRTLRQVQRLLGAPGKPAAAPAPAPQKADKPGRRPRRRKYETTADESILAFVKAKGTPTTRDIKKHWEGEGRRGTADNPLSKLVKAGKLKRLPAPGERGSRYTLP